MSITVDSAAFVQVVIMAQLRRANLRVTYKPWHNATFAIRPWPGNRLASITTMPRATAPPAITAPRRPVKIPATSLPPCNVTAVTPPAAGHRPASVISGPVIPATTNRVSAAATVTAPTARPRLGQTAIISRIAPDAMPVILKLANTEK